MDKLQPVGIDFYRGSTVEVARRLIGRYLCRESEQGPVYGVIVETEAYLSSNDPACHASIGRTGRNETMFGPAGRAYVYLIYGIHYCLNVVTGPENKGEAVLVRAVEPAGGLELMKQRRGLSCPPTNLASGPGKLCLAFAIDKALDGHDLQKKPLYIAENKDAARYSPIKTTPRIGISAAQDRLLRFVVPGNRHLSRREPIG